jgi:pimeloyl-ACP methyl ester carboxylesterase
MPGHAGAPPPEDYSVENYARITAELAKSSGVDLVVGFSIGAAVAFEMVVSGAWARFWGGCLLRSSRRVLRPW